jgi:hypothetical protein
VIVAPPVLAGGVKLTVALPLPPVAATLVGVPGAVIGGVTADEAPDDVPAPTALVAVTVNVYATPFVNPVTVIGEDGPLAVIPLGEDVTV